MKYDLAVVIGRFQPVHNGHLALINEAKKIAKEVLVLVGSCYLPRSYENPFDFDTRRMMLNSTQNPNDSIVRVEPTMDTIYNDNAWVAQVQEHVAETGAKTICLVGHKKDDSSYYLDLFPQWDYQDVGLIQGQQLHATSIRDLYFRRDANMDFISAVIPNGVFNILADVKGSDLYDEVIEEREFQENYKKQFEHLPYPPVFVTADAVVFCSGHVLMIRRRSYPGKGLMALPGGFLETQTDKNMLDCAIRELKEETNIDMPIPVLKGSVSNSHVFDAVKRSARGRTITHAFNIQLPNKKLPKVKGGSDAASVRWVPFSEVRSEKCFEDHYQILEHFLGA